ncbi:MAG: hypothetical protein ABF820_07470 [Sporolactobacillus sp.]
MHSYWHNKAFRTLTNAGLLDSAGNSLYAIVFIIYAATLPYPKLAVSLTAFMTMLPTMLQLLSGYWADRPQHKLRAMVTARLLQTGLFLLLACLIGRTSSFILFATLLLINFICDILGQYSNGLVLPLLKHILPSSAMNDALSLTSASTESIKLIGQGAGAGLIVLLNHQYALFAVMNAATFLLAAWIVIHQRKIIVPEAIQSVKHVASRPFLRESWQTICGLRREQDIFSLLVLFFFVNTVDSSSDALVSLSLVSTPSFWIGNFGNTVAACAILFSAGLILGALLSHDWFKNWSLTALLAITLTASLTIGLNFILHGSVWLLLISMFILGYTLGKIGPRFSSLMIARIDELRLAATAGAVNTVLLIGAPLGQGLFLGLANLTGCRSSWLLYSLLAALLIIFSWMTGRSLERQNKLRSFSK